MLLSLGGDTSVANDTQLNIKVCDNITERGKRTFWNTVIQNSVVNRTLMLSGKYVATCEYTYAFILVLCGSFYVQNSFQCRT